MASEIKHSIEVEIEHIPQTQPGAESHTILDLEGMTCASCAMRIEKGLKKVPGVKDANVNLATEQATVTYDPTQTGLEPMVQKVEAVGYKATPQASSQQETAHGGTAGNVLDLPFPAASNVFQEDEQSRRRSVEIIRKRNLLILGIVLT